MSPDNILISTTGSVKRRVSESLIGGWKGQALEDLSQIMQLAERPAEGWHVRIPVSFKFIHNYLWGKQLAATRDKEEVGQIDKRTHLLEHLLIESAFV